MDIFSDALHALTEMLSGLWPQPKENPHLVDGKLRPCPGTPNGVCSESTNPVVSIDPLSFSAAPSTAWEALQAVIREKGGELRTLEPGYLWATFTIPLFGFVDDVEFRLCPQEGVIHLRSSSRIGFSDLGVNRGRVETLRAAFQKALAG